MMAEPFVANKPRNVVKLIFPVSRSPLLVVVAVLATLAAGSCCSAWEAKDEEIRETVSFLEKHGCQILFERAADLQSPCTLDLSKGHLSDAELSRVNALPNIRALLVLESNIGHDGLLAIRESHWTNIRDLRISKMRIGDKLFQRILKSRAIETLCLDDTGLENNELESLGVLKRLTWLSVRGNGLTDRGLISLLVLKDLDFLDVSNTQITDASALAVSKSLQHLQILDLSGTSVSDKGLSLAGDLKELHDLGLNFERGQANRREIRDS